MVLFIQYLSKMYKPMQELSKMTDTYSKAAVGYERIQEILQTDNEVRDLKGSAVHGIGLTVSGLVHALFHEMGALIPVSTRVGDNVSASLA